MFSRADLESAIGRLLVALGRSPEEVQGSSTLGARLSLWAERVSQWNSRIDLTAARSPEQLVDLLLADAAVLAATLDAGVGQSWVDVGSGAGAPGLGVALFAPELTMTLVEPKAKRVAFLRSVLGSLGRADVRVERARSEALPGLSFDVAVSRATLEPSAWLTEGTRLARRRVWVLLAQQAPPVAPDLESVDERRYRWPLTGVTRHAVAYERITV